MVLSEQDRGKTVGVSSGDTVTLRLKENPTTGYRWELEAAHGLQPLGDNFAPGGAVGAAGIREFQFRATTPGNQELRLKHWCEWEGDASVTDRFQITVTVK